MKISTLGSAILLALPLADAWRVQLYDKENYKTEIHDRSGKVGQPCKNLGKHVNKAQSMHWDATYGIVSKCRIRLYNAGDCSGKPLGDSDYTHWNVPAFSSKAKNKVNSYKIDCKY
jgi:hypothetical protein